MVVCDLWSITTQLTEQSPSTRVVIVNHKSHPGIGRNSLMFMHYVLYSPTRLILVVIRQGGFHVNKVWLLVNIQGSLLCKQGSL